MTKIQETILKHLEFLDLIDWNLFDYWILVLVPLIYSFRQFCQK